VRRIGVLMSGEENDPLWKTLLSTFKPFRVWDGLMAATCGYTLTKVEER
jgi:hypothetical protein